MATRTQVFAFLVLGTSLAHADDPPSTLDNAQKLTLDDLFKAAVRSAPQLQAAAFDAAVARGNLIAATGAEDLNTSLSVNDSKTVQVASTSSNLAYTAALSRLLPTNGLLALTASATKSKHDEPRLQTVFATVDLGLKFSQPILAGAGPAVERATIRANKHAWSAATIRRAAVARDFVADVVESYWRLSLAWRQLEVHKKSLESAKKQYAAIQRGLATGALAKSEAIPFEQTIAQRKIDIVTDERDIIAQSLDLRTLVGLEISPVAPALRTLELPPPPVIEPDIPKLAAQALAISDELKAALEDIKSADASLDAAQRNKMPQLDLSLSGDLTTTHNSYRDALIALRDTPGYVVTVGATFNLPVGRNRAIGTYEAARATSARARFTLAAQGKAVSADVVRFATEVRANTQTIKLGADVVTLAQQNLDAEIKKFELGKSTSNEIILRQNDLDGARLRLEQINAQATISQARLEALTGQILTHYGIKMLEPEKVTSDAFTGK